MNSFIDFIDNLLVTINNSINEKIFGTGYLEIVKFQLIEKLIVLDNKVSFPICNKGFGVLRVFG